MRAADRVYTQCFLTFYLLSFPVLCDSSCSPALILIFCTAAESLWCDDKVRVSRPLAPAVIHGHSAGHTLTTWLVCPIHLPSSHTAKDSSAAIISPGDEGRGCTSVTRVWLRVWLYSTVVDCRLYTVIVQDGCFFKTCVHFVYLLFADFPVGQVHVTPVQFTCQWWASPGGSNTCFTPYCTTSVMLWPTSTKDRTAHRLPTCNHAQLCLLEHTTWLKRDPVPESLWWRVRVVLLPINPVKRLKPAMNLSSE